MCSVGAGSGLLGSSVDSTRACNGHTRNKWSVGSVDEDAGVLLRKCTRVTLLNSTRPVSGTYACISSDIPVLAIILVSVILKSDQQLTTSKSIMYQTLRQSLSNEFQSNSPLQ